MTKAPRSESTYTKLICKQLETQGCDITVLSGTRFSRNNSDRLVIHRDGVWLLEFKNVNGRVRTAQKVRGQQINKRRPFTYWIVQATDYTTLRGYVMAPFDLTVCWHFEPGELLNLLKALSQ